MSTYETKTAGPVSDRMEQERILRATLLLSFTPVAVTVLGTPAEFDEFCGARPIEPLHYCAAVRRAAEGDSLKIAASDMACDTSPKFLGFDDGHTEPGFVSSYTDGGLYRDDSVARDMLERAAVIPPLTGLGVVPLGMQPTDIEPDVVIVMADPHAAMRISQAAGYLGHPMAQQTMGMHGMCAETTAAPIVNGEIGISLMCSGARHTGDWPDSVLSVGIPGHLLGDVVTGLQLTADRFEPDRRKERIADAGEGAPELVPGRAYFLR